MVCMLNYTLILIGSYLGSIVTKSLKNDIPNRLKLTRVFYADSDFSENCLEGS